MNKLPEGQGPGEFILGTIHSPKKSPLYGDVPLIMFLLNSVILQKYGNFKDITNSQKWALSTLPASFFKNSTGLKVCDFLVLFRTFSENIMVTW